MATIEQLSAALIKADAAGNAADAKAFADEIRKMRATSKPIDPTEGMSTFDKLAAGFGKAIVDTGRGAGQLMGLVDRKDVEESRRLDAPLMNTGAGQVGNFAGNVAAVLPAAFIPGAATIPGAAAIGSIQGLMQPSTSTGETFQNVGLGGAAGAGGVMAGRALSGLYQGGKALIEPFTQGGRENIAGRVIQRFADDPAKVLAAKGGTSITGATPTIAEETADAGMARLQDSLRSVDPQIENRILNRLQNNNAARVASLEGLAGDDVTRAAADEARKKATGPAYEQATKAAYIVDDKLQSLLDRPLIKQAMERAKKIASNDGRTFDFTTTSSGTFSGVGGGAPTVTKQVTGNGLQDLKMAIDALLKDPASGIVGKEATQAKNLRAQIINWMEAANPEFKVAREGYAAASKPLNQMDVGAKLLKSGSSNVSNLSGDVTLSANKLTGLLKDEGKLIESATGRKGVGTALGDVLTPEQENLVRTLIGEVDRTGAVASAGNGPGPATAQRMASQNVLSRLIGPTGLPQSWAESAIANTVVGKPLNLLYGGVAEPKIQQILAGAVLDPAQARAALQAAQKQGIKLPDNVLTRLAGQAARATPSTLAVTGQR